MWPHIFTKWLYVTVSFEALILRADEFQQEARRNGDTKTQSFSRMLDHNESLRRNIQKVYFKGNFYLNHDLTPVVIPDQLSNVSDRKINLLLVERFRVLISDKRFFNLKQRQGPKIDTLCLNICKYFNLEAAENG